MCNNGKNKNKKCVFFKSFIQAYNGIDSDLVAHFPHAAPQSSQVCTRQHAALTGRWGSVCVCCGIKVGASVIVCFPSMLEMVSNMLAKTAFSAGSQNIIHMLRFLYSLFPSAMK